MLVFHSQMRSLGSDEYFYENISTMFPFTQKNKLNIWNY